MHIAVEHRLLNVSAMQGIYAATIYSSVNFSEFLVTEVCFRNYFPFYFQLAELQRQYL